MSAKVLGFNLFVQRRTLLKWPLHEDNKPLVYFSVIWPWHNFGGLSETMANRMPDWRACHGHSGIQSGFFDPSALAPLLPSLRPVRGARELWEISTGRDGRSVLARLNDFNAQRFNVEDLGHGPSWIGAVMNGKDRNLDTTQKRRLYLRVMVLSDDKSPQNDGALTRCTIKNSLFCIR